MTSLAADRARGLLVPPGVARGRGRRLACTCLWPSLTYKKTYCIRFAAAAAAPPTALQGRIEWHGRSNSASVDSSKVRNLQLIVFAPNYELRLFSLIACNSIAIVRRISIRFHTDLSAVGKCVAQTQFQLIGNWILLALFCEVRKRLLIIWFFN